MKDPLEKFVERLDMLQNMKVEINNSNSGIIFPNDVTLSNSPEDAINQARAEAMKRNMPFEEPSEASEKNISDSGKRYLDELVNKMIDDILRG